MSLDTAHFSQHLALRGCYFRCRAILTRSKRQQKANEQWSNTPLFQVLAGVLAFGAKLRRRSLLSWARLKTCCVTATALRQSPSAVRIRYRKVSGDYDGRVRTARSRMTFSTSAVPWSDKLTYTRHQSGSASPLGRVSGSVGVVARSSGEERERAVYSSSHGPSTKSVCSAMNKVRRYRRA
jgi:hypothetical protein